MSFISYAFFFLLAIVLLLRLLSDRFGFRRPFLFGLIAASMVFYGWHIPYYLAIILFSTAVDYVAGGRIAAAAARPRRFWLVASLVANLGVLAFFKYLNFGLDQIEALRTWLGFAGSNFVHFELVLPIGISFYTFQSMSYTIDIYRHRLEPVSSFWRFLLFVSFFPQLVAGPIVRAHDFLYQIDRRRRVRARVWLEGAYLIIRGLFLKMVVADNIGGIVDEKWAVGYGPEANGLLSLYVALLFSCQIFCDFAGYSSIARGLAYLLGFRLPVNFNSPYIAASFSEFWRRWHITLSTWLRDYLYIPLGGNRLGLVRTYVNLLIVMLLGGLWHGAANTFIIWGAIHGGALAVERVLGLQSGARSLPLRLSWALVTQAVVLVAWVFFRSSNARTAAHVLSSIFTGPYEALPDANLLLGLLYVVPVAMIHIRTLACKYSIALRPRPVEKAVWAAAMAYLTVTAYATNQTFIYFQF